MITKVLIANRGENARPASVSLNGWACAAGCGDLAPRCLSGVQESK